MEQYRGTPMDLADASLVATAEVLNLSRIFTLDSDFYVYRINNTGGSITPEEFLFDVVEDRTFRRIFGDVGQADLLNAAFTLCHLSLQLGNF